MNVPVTSTPKISFPGFTFICYLLGPVLIVIGLLTMFSVPGEGLRLEMTQVAVGVGMFWSGFALLVIAVVITVVRSMLNEQLALISRMHQHGVTASPM